jgi:hypothetical protein
VQAVRPSTVAKVIIEPIVEATALRLSLVSFIWFLHPGRLPPTYK